MQQSSKSRAALRDADTAGIVVTYALGHGADNHVAVTRAAIAAKLAKLKRFDFAGSFDPAVRYGEPLYLVPSDTLVGLEAAAQLGVRTEDDVFGGVVPTAFAATKTITHPLVHPQARAPAGWSPPPVAP